MRRVEAEVYQGAEQCHEDSISISGCVDCGTPFIVVHTKKTAGKTECPNCRAPYTFNRSADDWYLKHD